MREDEEIFSDDRKEAERLLVAIRLLENNAAWREIILPFLQRQQEIALEGVTRRNGSAQERSEYVEAYHMLSEAIEHLSTRKSELEATFFEK